MSRHSQHSIHNAECEPFQNHIKNERAIDIKLPNFSKVVVSVYLDLNHVIITWLIDDHIDDVIINVHDVIEQLAHALTLNHSLKVLHLGGGVSYHDKSSCRAPHLK